jgi:hypothetical protein
MLRPSGMEEGMKRWWHSTTFAVMTMQRRARPTRYSPTTSFKRPPFFLGRSVRARSIAKLPGRTPGPDFNAFITDDFRGESLRIAAVRWLCFVKSQECIKM